MGPGQGGSLLQAQIEARSGEDRAWLEELLAEITPFYADACEEYLREG